MAENKFELKITTDSSGKEINIQDMSLETVKKFMVLVEAFTKIVELTPNSDKITISIISNSIGVAAKGNEVKNIVEDYNKVKEQDSIVKDLFPPYNLLQKTFSENGFGFEANYNINGQTKSIYEELKNSSTFKSKPEKKKFESLPVFIHGYFFEGGGKKKKNLHVQPPDSKKPFKVACTAENSRKARMYLGGDIFLSAWVGKSGKGDVHVFCDSYVNNNIFTDLKTFIDDIRDEDEIDALSKIHDKIREYLDAQDYGRFRKFMRLFVHDSIDVNILNEFLLLTEPFKDYERIKDSRTKMEEIFDRKMRAYKKINPKNSWLH